MDPFTTSRTTSDRPSPLADVKGQIFLGGEPFLREMQKKLSKMKPDRSIPRAQRQLSFVARRFRPGSALGLSLTVSLLVVGALGWAFGAVLQDVLSGTSLDAVDRPVLRFFVRHREQIHSNLIGLHVDSLGRSTADRLAAYRHAGGSPWEVDVPAEGIALTLVVK